MTRPAYRHPCPDCVYLGTHTHRDHPIVRDGVKYDMYIHTGPDTYAAGVHAPYSKSIWPYIHKKGELVIRRADYEREYGEEMHGTVETAASWAGYHQWDSDPFVAAYRAAIARGYVEGA
jgi:hypothetical protein